MTLYILAFLAGALTLLAPCILPVLPFVFARADRGFLRNGLPLLAGMAVTFAAVATLAAVAGNWAAEANQYGRIAALALLAVMGLALVAPRLGERLGRPLAALGNRLAGGAARIGGGSDSTVLPSFLTGAATGLLWAPCAGPILGLILTGAALEGPSIHTALLLLAYAAGAASSLALALLASNRILSAMKRSLGVGEWLRRAMGVAVLAGVAAVALGLDTGVLAQVSPDRSQAIERHLFQWFAPGAGASAANHIGAPGPAVFAPSTPGMLHVQVRPAPALPVEGRMPAISGAVEWLNSPALTADSLRGKVVLVDFWTFGCVNCRNALPHVRGWYDKYKDQGLVVVGIHTPEFAFEKNIGNVKRAVGELGITFPVAIDNNFAVWRAFGNNYWPAHYFVDARGNIRFHHFGEGEYEKSEQVIQQLLEEARRDPRQPV
jgi:cytochrome c biogenesis protein CcdA/thiol-disulfide isomerase/thioredoxin